MGTSTIIFFVAVAPENDPIGALAGLVFMASMAYTFVAHYSLIFELRKRGVEISFFMWGCQLFLLQFEYLKNRDAVRSKKLDFLARSAIVAPLIGLAFLLGAFVIWPGRP